MAPPLPARDPREGDVDVVVVGGGPAGLSAALVLGRSRRSVLVVDAGEPRNAPAEALHGFLTRDGTPPEELLALGRAEVAAMASSITPDRPSLPPEKVLGSGWSWTVAGRCSRGGWW